MNRHELSVFILGSAPLNEEQQRTAGQCVRFKSALRSYLGQEPAGCYLSVLHDEPSDCYALGIRFDPKESMATEFAMRLKRGEIPSTWAEMEQHGSRAEQVFQTVCKLGYSV